MNFFAKKPYLGNAYPKLTDGSTIWRLSSVIRGEQIAKYLGAKYNPETRDDGVCIFIKPQNLDAVKDGDYVDYCDQSDFIKLDEQLKARPKVKVIAISQTAKEHLEKILPNEIITIPQQHLNWENALRDRKEFRVGGYIGRPSNISFKINQEIKETLEKIGLKFVTCFKWETREDAIKFYKSIDFLVIGGNGLDWKDNTPFVTPTKMINAASFGVPSFAYPLLGYKEFEGYYIPIKSMQELTEGVIKLRKEYADFSKKIIEKAKEYHISKIANLYKVL